MTRDEHIVFCKERALKELCRGKPLDAFTSMASDLGKHPETADHVGIKLGLQLMLIGQLGTVPEMKRFIEGFN